MRWDWSKAPAPCTLYTFLTNTKVSFPACETTISDNPIHMQGDGPVCAQTTSGWAGCAVHERDKTGMTQRDLPHLGRDQLGKKSASDISLV